MILAFPRELLDAWRPLRRYERVAAITVAMAFAMLVATVVILQLVEGFLEFPRVKGAPVSTAGSDAEFWAKVGRLIGIGALALAAPGAGILYTTFRRWRAYDPAALRIGWPEWSGVLATAIGISAALVYFPALAVGEWYFGSVAGAMRVFGPAFFAVVGLIAVGCVAESDFRKHVEELAGRSHTPNRTGPTRVARPWDWSFALPITCCVIVGAPLLVSFLAYVASPAKIQSPLLDGELRSSLRDTRWRQLPDSQGKMRLGDGFRLIVDPAGNLSAMNGRGVSEACSANAEPGRFTWSSGKPTIRLIAIRETGNDAIFSLRLGGLAEDEEMWKFVPESAPQGPIAVWTEGSPYWQEASMPLYIVWAPLLSIAGLALAYAVFVGLTEGNGYPQGTQPDYGTPSNGFEFVVKPYVRQPPPPDPPPVPNY